MIDELQKAVTDFVNDKNKLYIQDNEYRNNKIQKYRDKITSLSDTVALPDIGGHTAEDNTKLIEIYEKDIADLDKQENRNASEKFRNDAKKFHLDELKDIIMTKTFNNSYDITYGYVFTNVSKEDWTQLFNSACREDKLQNEQRIALIEKAVRSANEDTLLKIANHSLNAKDTLRTISSLMERSEWGECTLRNPDSCNMPNKKRTPDIAVCVICQLHEDSVSYPILISEILGKKEPGSRVTMLLCRHLYLLHVVITGRSLSLMPR